MSPRVRRIIVSVALASLASSSVSACSGTSGTAGSSSTQLCKAALRHQVIASSTPTTVGAVRALGGGPAGHAVAPTAFPGAKSSAPAAWCWVSTGGHSWTAYAAGPGKQSIRLASYDGPTTAPSGAPAIK